MICCLVDMSLPSCSVRLSQLSSVEEVARPSVSGVSLASGGLAACYSAFHLFHIKLWRVSSVLANGKINLLAKESEVLSRCCVSTPPPAYCLVCSLICPPVIAAEIGRPCGTPQTQVAADGQDNC